MLQQHAAAGSATRQQGPTTAGPSSSRLPPPISRRGALASLAAGLLPFASTPHPAAADAQDEPACASCVGYVEGTLGSCSAVGAPCSSSYDDRPQHFVAPWTYDGSREAAMDQLVDQLQVVGARVQQRTSDYVYAVLDSPGGGAGMDLEFVFAPADTTVALRAAQRLPPTADTTSSTTSISSSSSSSSATDAAQAALQLPANAVAAFLSQIGLSRDQPSQVLEDLRLQLNWEVVPILRNRQRTFFFGESPFDSFGPVPPPVPDYSKDLTDF